MGAVLKFLLPNASYFPGMGMLAGVLIVFTVGLMMKAYIIQRVFRLWEKLLYSLPLVKTIYRAFRDFFDYFSNKDGALSQVVAVNYNGFEAVGFITQDSKRLPAPLSDNDKVLVYIPMSYMVGGFTLLVPKNNTRSLDMSMDEALRFALTAGITGQNG
jgi:uncharacterized membrane protein